MSLLRLNEERTTTVNHYFIILKLFLVINGFSRYQIKRTALKLDYSYGKFTDTS